MDASERTGGGGDGTGGGSGGGGGPTAAPVQSTTPTSLNTISVGAPTVIVSQVLVGANTGRKALTIYNDSISALYIDFNGAVTWTADGANGNRFKVRISAFGYWEMETTSVFTGEIHGRWAAVVTGQMLATEQT